MKCAAILVTLLLAALHLIGCNSNPSRSPTRFKFPVGENMLSLSGLWKFQQGDDPSWSRLDFPDDEWRMHPVPGLWTKNDAANQGVAWYRTWIDIPSETASFESWGIVLSQIAVAAEIYWDGQLIARHGKVGSSKADEIPGQATRCTCFREETQVQAAICLPCEFRIIGDFPAV